ncbi:MFS transporter [Actinomadura barringtoniae]|uniref:MFS transporter n=1 Tax=Actinomadura barringtoniae TaxID=1427535 RepID=A0A939PJ47_9ACTN|nr:MDR family MFS transporter [Actinomadura barringtoniae]MBO2453867.1 MFS transporter [Actinomadura barringtoniae]
MSTTEQEAPSEGRIRLMLLGVMLAMLLSMLDNTIVGTAMPTIVRDVGGLDHLSWVVTAYILATAVSTPVWGKLGDLRGRKNVFLTAIVVFLIGSAASGAAQTMGQLIAFRTVQGLGAGGLAVGAFAVIADLVPPRERGRYQGMTSMVMALGTIGGPLLGGVVTGHLGWRWAFYINLPLGVIALIWSQVMLRLPAVKKSATIDWPGILILGATISTTVLAATWAGVRYAWTSPQILGLAIAALLGLAAFIWSQRRAVEPVLPLRIFGTRNLPLVAVLIAVVGGVMFGCSLYLPLFQQTVQHASATDSGLLLLPMMAPIVLVSQFPGRIMTRTGRYKIFPILGSILLAAGSFLLATMDTSTPRVMTALFMALIGGGLGCMMQMTTAIAQNSVEMRDIGAATAAVTLFRTLGGSIAVAVFGALFTRSLQNADGAHSGPAYLHAVANGTQHIFFLAGALCLVALAAALLVKEVPLRGKPTSPQPAKEPVTTS